jgi:ferric-dicitrate binding protein FerR (iron transport regulator)
MASKQGVVIMTTREKEERILEYLEGELSPDEEKSLRQEIAKDPEMAELLEEYQQQDRTLSTWFQSQSSFLDNMPRPDLSELPAASSANTSAGGGGRLTWWLAAAAAIALTVTGAFYFVQSENVGPTVASVTQAQGRPQAFLDDQVIQLDQKEAVSSSVQQIKTPANSYLELALNNQAGSLEMKENSTIALAVYKKKTELDLYRGEVLVNTRNDNPQGKTVRVKTPQFDVESGNGIFSVALGMRGGEVAVVSGDVMVFQGKGDRALKAGDTFSSLNVKPVPVTHRVVWSRHSDDYFDLIPSVESGVVDDEMVVAMAETDNTTAVRTTAPSEATTSVKPTSIQPALGTASGYLPAETIALVEFPDVGTLFRSTGRDNLADLFLNDQVRSGLLGAFVNVAELEDDLDIVEEKMDAIFDNEELNLVLSSLEGQLSIGITPRGLSAICQVNDPDGRVSAIVRDSWNPLVKESGGPDDAVYIAVMNGYFTFNANHEDGAEIIAALQSGTPTAFGYSTFLNDLHRMVPRSEFTTALDAASLIDRTKENSAVSMFYDRTGLSNMKMLVAATSFADQADNLGMRVTFDGERRGMIRWLDEPGPLNTFQFFSPDTHGLVAMRVKTPAEMLDQMLSWMSARNPNEPTEYNVGVQAVQRLTNTLGNEIAFGIDNPVLPIPNVKMVVEVVDPIDFHDAMLAVLDLAEEGNRDTEDQFDVGTEEYRNHLVVKISFPGKPFGVSYAVIHDYVVFGPGPTYLKNTIDLYKDQQTLNEEAAFWEAFPAKSGSYCSALLYLNNSTELGDAAPFVQQFLNAKNIPLDLVGMVGNSHDGPKAGVYYAIAEEDSIDLYIEGVKSDYQMSGLLPMVANWIGDDENNSVTDE